ncbi:hypothetical protein [Streptomyces sp. OP7]|uniref:hypothetical protein n=1 Tax=Streptomyces sp. OP7 TaxID=3142462 RepID=UPI0032E9124D
MVPTAGERMASPAREQVARPAVRPATKPAVRPAAEQLTSPTTQQLAPPVTGRLLRPAADHVVRAVVDQVVRPAADQVVRPAGQRVVGPVVDQVARPVGRHIVRSVAEPVLRPVAGQVLRPVGQLVRGVTEELGAGTVTVPVPHLPGLPVRLPPAADAVGRPQAPLARATVAPTPDGRAQDTPATHGPAAAPAATPPGTHPTPRPDGQHTAPVARASSPQVFRTPAGGAPGGALGSGSAVDQGTARHGDTGAVPAHHRPTPRLVPGATVRADAPGTRDHTRDVPVPPA